MGTWPCVNLSGFSCPFLVFDFSLSDAGLYVLMKIKMSVCLSLEQAQNKSDCVNMSLSFSPLCRQARGLTGKKVLAGGNDTSVSAGRRCLRGSWMAAVHMYFLGAQS